MYLHLTRKTDNGTQTTGQLKLCDNQGNVLLSFDTLELTFQNNERRISCIPTGCYVVSRKTSFSKGQCFALQNVLGRDNILIHKGNFNSDTKGCILIGHGYKNINFDDDLDILNSRLAMKQLLQVLRTTTTIEIVNEWNL
jgi:hypothetical protein